MTNKDVITGIVQMDVDGRCTDFRNMAVFPGGSVERVNLPVNAVLVQMVPGVDYDGNPCDRRVISIICVDSEMEPALKEEARRILQTAAE